MRIKVLLFPYHDVDADKLLNELQSAHFLKRYAIGAGRYIQIINFLKHQKPHPKEAPSTIPSREKVSTGRKKKSLSDVQDKPSPVGNGSGNGLGVLESGNGWGNGSGHTHTDQEVVCVPKSKFALDQIRAYAWESYRLDQWLVAQGQKNVDGIRNPDGWAVTAHRSGEFDGLVQEWVDDPKKFSLAS